jgi:PAS domain S-box-containing protein
VLAVTSALGEASILAALAAGARDVALRTRPEHVQFVVRNEFNALLGRRALRHLEASLRESERRCDALISSSRDPIAYVHQGMHIRANKAYLDMFGFEDFEDIEGLSVLDLLAGHHADQFKLLLKRIDKGEAPPRDLDIRARKPRRARSSTRPWNSPRPPTKANPACRSCSGSRPWTRRWRASWTSCASAIRSPSCSTASTSWASWRRPSPWQPMARARRACS